MDAGPDAGTGQGYLIDQHFRSKLTSTVKLEEDAIKD